MPNTKTNSNNPEINLIIKNDLSKENYKYANVNKGYHNKSAT
jgi:hypothetical protein